MIKELRTKLGSFLAREHIADLSARATRFEERINQRVAKELAGMDPFEPLLREFKGVFSEEFERVEDRLSPRDSLGMKMWAFGVAKDPHFKHLLEWVMNSEANETLKRVPVTTDRILYGRAFIAAMILFRNEIRRLALLYEEELNKDKEDFNSEITTE